MFKKIMQSLTLVIGMVTCLSFAPNNIKTTYKQISINDTVIACPIEDDTRIFNDVSVDIERLHISTSSEPIEEPEPEPEPEPGYYVEVIDGYITEDSLYSICKDVGKLYSIPPELLMAIAWNESSYNIYCTGSSGDMGLCQIVAKWHSERMERLGVNDIYDPYGNVLMCADFLNELRGGEYGDDVRYVLMAYNMGEYNAKKHYASGTISKYANKVMNTVEELQVSGYGE